MSKINRRSILKFITSTTVCAGSPATIASSFSPTSAKQPRIRKSQERVAIGRQDLPYVGEHVVDLWATPFSTIFHDNSIPNECARCLIYTDISPDDRSAFIYLRNSLSRPDQIWNGKAGEYVQGVAGSAEFSGILCSLIKEGKSRQAKRRIALIDLDSSMGLLLADPTWIEILTALRKSYDVLIGYIHIRERGASHWLAACCACGWFESQFRKPMSICDVLVFGSQSLIENDSNLSALKSTEGLASELVGRLCQALLDPRCSEIIPAKERSPVPLAYALGSSTTMVGAADVGLRDLTRQRELVQGTFGNWNLARRPLLIATQTNDTAFNSLRLQIQGTDFLLFRAGADIHPQCNDPLKTVEIAALWPFELSFRQILVTTRSTE